MRRAKFFRRLRDTPVHLWPLLPLQLLTRPQKIELWAVNFLFQRILGVNAEVPWSVHYTSQVLMPSREHLQIGAGVCHSFAISGGCYIQAYNGITIGDDTIFAPGVKIVSANHDSGDFSRHLPGRPIVIGKRCWIGANAVILPQVTIGDDVIVGAGAVVTKSVPGGCVVAGNPARVIRADRARDLPDRIYAPEEDVRPA